jgi:hypothetical protein
MAKHTWRFARVGGFDQVQITTGHDLVNLGKLDQKLWVALACPVKGIEFDERTLALIDSDHDGRVRANELVAATKWTKKVLKKLDVLEEPDEPLPLDAIDDKQIREAAVAVLQSIGKADAKSISVADTEHAFDEFNKMPFNGDGVITAASAKDDATKKLLEDAIACSSPAKTDKSGAPGVDAAQVAAFLDAIAAHAKWLAEGEADGKTRPFEGAADAWLAVSAVRAKVEDFFARTKVAAFDARALAAVNRDQAEYASIAAADLDHAVAALSHFPLAQAAPDAPLPLERGVNPAWRDAISSLRDKAVKPALGDRAVLTETDWRALLAKLEGQDAWRKMERGEAVEKLGAARVREIAASDARAKLEALLAEEKKAEPHAAAIESVERITRYSRDLMKLANNFVSFRDFYAQDTPATFQVGTLYLDQRACELCVSVSDGGRHATMAPLANTYLLYCELKNAKGESRTIAAAMTNGDVDNLMVGRNGIFYDRKGEDWDATVVKIIDNPISIRQAFWAPYKKTLRLVEETIAKRAAAADAEANEKLAKGVEESQKEPAAEAAEEKSGGTKIDVGTLAAIGVAVGGITAAMGAMFGALFGLGLWMPVGILALMFAISGPSMAIAWLKLRKRNLGPILDANGWAVNAQAKLNVPFGASLTKLAAIPSDASRSFSDPFAEKSRPWGTYLMITLFAGGLIAGWYVGKLDRLLPKPARRATILGPYEDPKPATSAAPAK